MATQEFRDPRLIGRSLVNLAYGGIGNEASVLMQQYLYDPQYYDPIFAFVNKHLLNDQNSGSTFFGLICWNSIFSLSLALQVECDLQNNILGRARFLDTVRRSLPAALVVLNTVREGLQVVNDPRPDNHGMDIVMGLAAGLFLWYVNHRYDRPLSESKTIITRL